MTRAELPAARLRDVLKALVSPRARRALVVAGDVRGDLDGLAQPVDAAVQQHECGLAELPQLRALLGVDVELHPAAAFAVEADHDLPDHLLRQLGNVGWARRAYDDARNAHRPFDPGHPSRLQPQVIELADGILVCGEARRGGGLQLWTLSPDAAGALLRQLKVIAKAQADRERLEWRLERALRRADAHRATAAALRLARAD